MKWDLTAFVALGSNLGDSRQTVRLAFERLSQLSISPLLRSSLWESQPIDCPPGSPVFINAVAGLTPQPNETPETLLGRLQQLEQEFGRRRSGVRNEPRSLDLDLIAFGQQTRHSSVLTLPHPRAHIRRFVLQPLSELASDLVLPGETKTVSELLVLIQDQPQLKRLA